jgi:hypothetical protein
VKTSTVLGLVGTIFAFLDAAITPLFVYSFLSEFGSVETKIWVPGVICLFVTVFGLFGSLKGGNLGAFSMIIGSILMFLALGVYGWLPGALLFAGGIMAEREKAKSQLQNRAPIPL